MSMIQISQSLSDFKKEVALANFFHNRNFFQDKAIWRLLLKQYKKENGEYPLVFDDTGNATLKSLLEFEMIMDTFSNRIIPMHKVLILKDHTDVIPLNYKSALVNVSIYLRKS